NNICPCGCLPSPSPLSLSSLRDLLLHHHHQFLLNRSQNTCSFHYSVLYIPFLEGGLKLNTSLWNMFSHCLPSSCPPAIHIIQLLKTCCTFGSKSHAHGRNY